MPIVTLPCFYVTWPLACQFLFALIPIFALDTGDVIFLLKNFYKRRARSDLSLFLSDLTSCMPFYFCSLFPSTAIDTGDVIFLLKNFFTRRARSDLTLFLCDLTSCMPISLCSYSYFRYWHRRCDLSFKEFFYAPCQEWLYPVFMWPDLLHAIFFVLLFLFSLLTQAMWSFS